MNEVLNRLDEWFDRFFPAVWFTWATALFCIGFPVLVFTGSPVVIYVLVLPVCGIIFGAIPFMLVWIWREAFRA